MSKPKRVIKTIMVTFLLAVIFVVGWIFGVLGSQTVGLGPVLRRVCQFIFIAVVGLHGLFIFLLQPCRSKDARNEWLKWFYYITCRPHLYHQRGKIPGKSHDRSRQASSSTAPQDSNPPGGTSATLAKTNLSSSPGSTLVSSIARRFGYKSGDSNTNGDARGENPITLQGTFTKAKPTVSGLPVVVEETPLQASGENLNSSYSSFSPNQDPPPHTGSVQLSPSHYALTSPIPHPAIVDGVPPELPPPRLGSIPLSPSNSASHTLTKPMDGVKPEPPSLHSGISQLSPSHSITYTVHPARVDNGVRLDLPSRSRRATQPSPPIVDNGVRPELPPPRSTRPAKPSSSSFTHGGERPKAAPRTGKAARPLPPLPDSYVLHNKYAEESTSL